MNNNKRIKIIIIIIFALLFTGYEFYKVCFSASAPREIPEVSNNRLFVYIHIDTLEQELNSINCDWMEVSSGLFWKTKLSFKPIDDKKDYFIKVFNPDNIAVQISKYNRDILWDESKSSLTLSVKDKYVTMPVYLLNNLTDQKVIVPK